MLRELANVVSAAEVTGTGQFNLIWERERGL
jgi:hypothetical protein